jgi:hypothetical protein
MEVLNQLFSTFKVSANIMHNGQYCGNWAVDTSGTHYMSFHIISHGRCFLTVNNGADNTATLSASDIVSIKLNLLILIEARSQMELD